MEICLGTPARGVGLCSRPHDGDSTPQGLDLAFVEIEDVGPDLDVRRRRTGDGLAYPVLGAGGWRRPTGRGANQPAGDEGRADPTDRPFRGRAEHLAARA